MGEERNFRLVTSPSPFPILTCTPPFFDLMMVVPGLRPGLRQPCENNKENVVFDTETEVEVLGLVELVIGLVEENASGCMATYAAGYRFFSGIRGFAEDSAGI